MNFFTKYIRIVLNLEIYKHMNSYVMIPCFFDETTYLGSLATKGGDHPYIIYFWTCRIPLGVHPSKNLETFVFANPFKTPLYTNLLG